jgi:hypothetical protein
VGRARGGGRSGSAVLTLLVGGCLVLGLAGSVSAQLRASAAEIKSLTGQVEVQRKGQASWVAAVVGMRLVERDEIRAHAGATAILDLPDGSTLFVAENSRVVVTQLAVDPGNNARQALFHLVVGKVRALVSKAAITLVRSRQSNFAISTPTGVAAARGTLYEVRYAGNVMTVAVLPGQPGTGGGLVTCVPLFRGAAPVFVREGFASYAIGLSGCQPAVAFENLSAAEQASIGSLSNPVPPGSSFSGPVDVPSPGDVFGPPPGPPPPFSTGGEVDQSPGGPPSTGTDVGQQQPPSTQ